MSKTVFLGVLRALDPVVALGLVLPTYGMRLARRIGLERMPATHRMMQSLGVLPLRDHYHEPQIRPNDTTPEELMRDRPLPGIDLRLDAQRALLRRFRFHEELARIPVDKPPEGPAGGYWFENGYFGPGDGSIWYSMLRTLKPKLVVEIGSGFSTLMARRALAQNAAEGAPPARHVCIEPYRNDWLDDCGAEVIRERVEKADPAVFGELGENDVLFIDSSHVLRPGGDVIVEFLQILPRLAPGVVVHVHDIFTPKDYPWEWLFREHRLWNEQYMLESFLSLNPCFEVMLGNQHIWHAARSDLLSACIPEAAVDPGSSFYLRRTAAPPPDRSIPARSVRDCSMPG